MQPHDNVERPSASLCSPPQCRMTLRNRLQPFRPPHTLAQPCTTVHKYRAGRGLPALRMGIACFLLSRARWHCPQFCAALHWLRGALNNTCMTASGGGGGQQLTIYCTWNAAHCSPSRPKGAYGTTDEAFVLILHVCLSPPDSNSKRLHTGGHWLDHCRVKHHSPLLHEAAALETLFQHGLAAMWVVHSCAEEQEC